MLWDSAESQTISGTRGRHRTHCTPGLSGNSVFWAVAPVEMLGWRSRSIFRDWMRSKLCVKWVPSHPTVSAFPLPGSLNCFHGSLSQLTQLLAASSLCLGDRKCFWQGEGREHAEGTTEKVQSKRAKIIFGELLNWWRGLRESNLVLPKIRCEIDRSDVSTSLLRDAVIFRENSYCLWDWVPLSLSISRVELTLHISPQRSGLECLHCIKVVWRNSHGSFKISLSLISIHICSINFPSSTKYIYLKQTSKGNNLISWK